MRSCLCFLFSLFVYSEAPLFFSHLAYQDWHMGSVILACNEGSLGKILLLLCFFPFALSVSVYGNHTEFGIPTTPELTALKEYAIVRDTSLPCPFLLQRYSSLFSTPLRRTGHDDQFS
jgi:hypothetical protein